MFLSWIYISNLEIEISSWSILVYGIFFKENLFLI